MYESTQLLDKKYNTTIITIHYLMMTFDVDRAHYCHPSGRPGILFQSCPLVHISNFRTQYYFSN